MAIRSSDNPVRIAFFLTPLFSMMAFAAALEPLRSANRLSGRELFRWQLVSADGAPVTASNGIPVQTDGALAGLGKLEMLVVCSGLETHRIKHQPAVLHQLRRLARHGTMVGAISSGSFMLADAGLLAGHRCTVHWEYAEDLRARHPQLQVTQELYVIDGDVFTCSGGTAALDMMLHFVGAVGGVELALNVAEQFIHPHIRAQEEQQRLDLHTRYGIRSPQLITAIRLMEGSLDEPLDMEEIARRAHLSARQIERLFRKYLGSSPKGFYLGLRLARARTLLRSTASPLRMIALECGFTSQSHFSNAYKRAYGIAPTHEQRLFAVRGGRQPPLQRTPLGLQARKAAETER